MGFRLRWPWFAQLGFAQLGFAQLGFVADITNTNTNTNTAQLGPWFAQLGPLTASWGSRSWGRGPRTRARALVRAAVTINRQLGPRSGPNFPRILRPYPGPREGHKRPTALEAEALAQIYTNKTPRKPLPFCYPRGP